MPRTATLEKPVSAADVVGAVLAGWTDDRLCGLLRRRPDLGATPPPTMSALAERVMQPGSALQAYERLDRSAQQVAEVLALLPAPAEVSGVARLIAPGVRPQQLERSLAVLEALALVFRNGDGLAVNPGLVAIAGNTGLGPPLALLLGDAPVSELNAICKRLGIKPGPNKGATLDSIAAHVSDPKQARKLVESGPPGTVALVERALRDHGVVEASPYDLSDRTPAGWLASRGLLGVYEWYRLVMPGEVGLALRGGHVFDAFWPDEPEVPTEPVDPQAVDAAGAEAALSAVADLALLLEGWATEPPRLLKDGGVGVRDLRRAARSTERSERDVARLVDIAAAAGLAWVDERAGVALPTAAFDEWAALDGPARWARLVAGWLSADFDPSVAGEVDVNDKRIPPLLRRSSESAADRRRVVLGALAAAPPDAAVAPGPALWTRVRWSSPKLWRLGPAPWEMLAAWALEEAELLGVWARGALTTAGRRAAAGDLEGAAVALAERAPAVVEHFVLQADLTVVAPGVLPPHVAADLELLADVESRGAATVYRIGEHSLRRAFDAGRSAADIAAFLDAHAVHGVPQALSYLVADVGRRHGRARVGEARCYVRSEDPSLVAELAQVRALGRFNLRALAPTVLVGDAEPGAVLEAIRAAGYLPAPEDASGAVVIARPPLRRAPARVPTPSSTRPRPSSPGSGAVADVAGVVAALRTSGGAPKRPAPARAAPRPSQPPPPPRSPLLFEEAGRPTAIARGRDDIAELLELAWQQDWLLRMSYVNGKGAESQLNVAVLDVRPRRVTVMALPNFSRRTLNCARVQWARALTEAEEDQFL